MSTCGRKLFISAPAFSVHFHYWECPLFRGHNSFYALIFFPGNLKVSTVGNVFAPSES